MLAIVHAHIYTNTYIVQSWQKHPTSYSREDLCRKEIEQTGDTHAAVAHKIQDEASVAYTKNSLPPGLKTVVRFQKQTSGIVYRNS